MIIAIKRGGDKGGNLSTYSVAELVENGWSEDGIEGLTAAKLRAQQRAETSAYIVVVRDGQTGRVIANYAPRKVDVKGPVPRKLPDSDSLIKLRAANERLRENLENTSPPNPSGSSHAGTSSPDRRAAAYGVHSVPSRRVHPRGGRERRPGARDLVVVDVELCGVCVGECFDGFERRLEQRAALSADKKISPFGGSLPQLDRSLRLRRRTEWGPPGPPRTGPIPYGLSYVPPRPARWMLTFIRHARANVNWRLVPRAQFFTSTKRQLLPMMSPLMSTLRAAVANFARLRLPFGCRTKGCKVLEWGRIAHRHVRRTKMDPSVDRRVSSLAA